MGVKGGEREREAMNELPKDYKADIPLFCIGSSVLIICEKILYHFVDTYYLGLLSSPYPATLVPRSQ